jgi:D-tyrosyl-tRNA(Tyr) deacylase
MRAVVQRVTRAQVSVDGQVVGKIGRGLCVLIGAGQRDQAADADQLVEKVVNLRIFEDESGKMNRSLLDERGGLLAISQFTLYGDARKGRRPSFVDALAPEPANVLYERFVAGVRAAGVAEVATGRFRAMMDVELVNTGPVTILIDTEKAF